MIRLTGIIAGDALTAEVSAHSSDAEYRFYVSVGSSTDIVPLAELHLERLGIDAGVSDWWPA